MSFDKNNQNRTFVNQQIRAIDVLLINSEGQNLGKISTTKALKIALEQGLDLVQVSQGEIPTCKIVNYGKFKFDAAKKEKELNKKQRGSQIKEKEIKFRPNTDIGDLKTKAKQVDRFLIEGYKVKCIIRLNGREVSHQDIALDTFNHFISLIDNTQAVNIPSFEKTHKGGNLTAYITRKL